MNQRIVTLGVLLSTCLFISPCAAKSKSRPSKKPAAVPTEEEENTEKDVAAPDHPRVTWGQFPDKLKLNIFLKETSRPRVEANSTHVMSFEI